MAEIIGIYTCNETGKDTVEQTSVEARAGYGLFGDRYYREDIEGGNKNAVTLQAIEDIEACNLQMHSNFVPSAFRRNLITRGIDLNSLIGRNFYIGEVLLHAWEHCQPCHYLQKMLQAEVLTGMLDRGGVRAEIIKGGIIRPGMPIKVVEPI